ncbi:hypothetical protein [Williamsia sp.]|uniref:hypothetical protein n=1 Tax=Williamsia sp. TaxID=1872085 RepID=UPI001A33326E|nr:hypothetical protein [Williamsia sp.]MBJ7289746.1 hypothetical protein [Williamsia sp.]
MRRRVWSVPLAVVIVGVVITTALMVTSATEPLADIAVPSAPVDPPHSAAGGPALSTVLAKTDEPVNLLVVGDGTGKSSGSWVFLAAQSLGQRFGRTVEIRDWRLGSAGRYGSATRAWSARGAPVTIWNASTSRNITYFRQTLDRWIPGGVPHVDVVIVSNGVVVDGGELAQRSIELMTRLRERLPGAAVVAVLQPTSPGQRSVSFGGTTAADDLRVSARINRFQTIDVDAAFARSEPGAVFAGPTAYPNADGYRLWATTVSDALASTVRIAPAT